VAVEQAVLILAADLAQQIQAVVVEEALLLVATMTVAQVVQE
jgi:hypothetical protein